MSDAQNGSIASTPLLAQAGSLLDDASHVGGHWLPSLRPDTLSANGEAQEDGEAVKEDVGGQEQCHYDEAKDQEESPSAISGAQSEGEDGPPPPLPPRPRTIAGQADSPVGSLRVMKSSARPRLQSKPTTMLSVADFHSELPAEHDVPNKGLFAPPMRASRSISNLSQLGGRRKSSMGDTSSIRSVRSILPGRSRSEDVESLFGDMIEPVELGGHSDEHIFESRQHEDAQFEALFEHEFVELEELDSHGNNEEELMIRWRMKLKHFLILSSAGKPIYSRHGDDQLISNSIGVIQTIISFYQGADDTLKGFTAGDTRFVILSKGHLHLVAISRLEENDAQLRGQLEALYMQILSTLTLPNMQKMFINRPSTDLRRPLQGTTTLLSALADSFTRGSPSTLLSALECLHLRKTQRDGINRTLAKCKSPSLLYGLVVAGGRLVSVLRPKKHSLHPGDLQLIFNMLFEADGVRAGGGESWIPLCLPGFNNTGYLYMYVSFVTSSEVSSSQSAGPEGGSGSHDETAIIFISANKEAFFELRKMRDDLVSQLESNGGMSAIRTSVRSGRPACTDIVPGTVVRHFLYKSRANVQFTMPSTAQDFGTTIAWRRLMTLYGTLHAAVHGKNSHLKVYSCVHRHHVSLVWVTPLFELYCVAAPGANRNALAQGANKLVQWARAEEERLFIIGGAVF
jgi:hypothetical protein